MNDHIDEDQINYSEIEIKKEQEKPLEMRIVSKIDFIRKSAYEEIGRKGLIEQYLDNINSFLSDSSSGPLSSALELLYNYIKQIRPSDDKAEIWARTIIEKSFSCSQMQCQDLSKAILCELLSKNYDPIIKLIKANLSSTAGKNTKKIMQYENILQHLIAEFGKSLGFEAVDSIIKGLTTASNPGIRNLAMKLIKDIYMWDKDNVIANQLLKDKEKEAIDYNRKDITPNRTIMLENSIIETTTNNNSQAKQCEDIPSSIIQTPIQTPHANSNANENNLNQIQDNSTCDYYLSESFFNKLSAKHQKANEKKKLLEELTVFLTQSPQYINNVLFTNQFTTLFNILKNFLNENNTNIISAVIRLLSHLSKHFSHNENYTSFLLDILPKLLDKFNLSNEGINDEVHALLHDIVQLNISFNHFLVFIENISSDDNINYTINILSFALNQIKQNEKFNLKSFPNSVIDAFQRLSIDDHEVISNLGFNAIEILNMREDTEVVKKEEPKEEPMKEIKIEKVNEVIIIKNEVKQEETKNDNNNNNQPKTKTFRNIKKKKESLNKNQSDKDVRSSNSNVIASNVTTEDLGINKKNSNSGNDNVNEIKNKEMKETPIVALPTHVEREREHKEEELNKQQQVNIIKKANSMNNDERLVGVKGTFNQKLFEEMKESTEEKENTKIPQLIEKETKPISITHKSKKDITPFSKLKQNEEPIALLNKQDEELQANKEEVAEEQYTPPKETKEQALLSFEKKMELALKKEEEEQSISRNPNNDDTTTSNPGNDQVNQPNKKKPSQDESQFEEIKGILGEEIVANIDSDKWEAKKQAFEDISSFIQSNSLPSGTEESLFQYLKFKLKGFKETNFNINREAINLFILLFSTKGLVFNSQTHLTILNAYYDKLCDSKLKDQTNQLLATLLDILGVHSVICSLVSKLQKKPNVNLLKDYAVFFSKCIEDYEMNQLPIKELVDYCKMTASNVNPQVRTASISLLCSLYKYIGNDIRLLIKDIKESTLKLIEAEFEKVTLITPDTPRRFKGKKKEIISYTNTNNNNNDESSNGVVIDNNKSNELIPRRDISKKITPKLIKDIRDGKWPEKKEACEAIEKILIEANMKIVPDGLAELFNLIKAKLSDGNKNIVRMVINLLSKLIEATGSGFKSFTKNIALALLPNFADKTQLLRDECHLCLEKWVACAGFDTFALYIPQFLKTDNVDMRLELLRVITKNKELMTKQLGESIFKEMASPLLFCLQDKSALVRSAAEEMIIFSFQFINLNHYNSGLKDFKPAIENDLRIILAKLKEDEGGSSITKHESSSILISSTTISTSMRTPPPCTNHASTPNNCSGINVSKKDEVEKKAINTPVSEQKKVQSIRVYKKEKQQLSNEDIKIPFNKPLSTTPTHSNKEVLVNIAMMTNANNTNNVNTNANVNNSSIINTSIIKSPNMTNKVSSIFHNKKSSVSKYQVFLSNVNVKPNKEKRSDYDRKYKFSLETLTSDSENKLRDQVRGLFTEDFIRKIFNEDFKQVVNSLQSLSLVIQKDETCTYLIDNLDIILKIIGYKFNINKNPLMVKGLMDFFEILYVKISNNVTLNDTEGHIIVCLLVDKLGISNSTLKDHLLTLIDNYFLLITPYKAMLIALNCALGKNTKIKAEILEVLTIMYINQSIDIINRPFVRMLSRFLSVNDNNVKGKTIALFKEIYSKISDELWSIIDLNDKERECLEANLYEHQRQEEDEYVVSESDDDNNNNNDDGNDNTEYQSSDSSSENNNNNNQGNTNNNNTQSANPNVPLMLNQPLTTFNSNYITNFNNNTNTNNNNNDKDNGVNRETQVSSNLILENNSFIKNQNDLLLILQNLLSNDNQKKVNTIIALHEFICTKYEDNKELLIQNVDNIVTSFIEAMNSLFANKQVDNIPIKFAKYLATVLCKITINKEFISLISYNVLFKLSEEILSNYLIENLDKIGENKEGSIILRSLNSTMLRLLDNCNSSHIIQCLLELVRINRAKPSQTKLASLSIQCLIKLNENLERIIDVIEVDKVLLQFHLLICDMEIIQPDLEMKSQTDQMIIRFIKNLIKDIVKFRKAEIVNDYIKGVKSHPVNDKYLIKWIKNVLSSLNIYPQLPFNTNENQLQIGNNPISKSNTSLPIASLALMNGYNNKLNASSINYGNHNHNFSNSSNNVIHVQTQAHVQSQTLNESSKDIIVEKKTSANIKKGESIIEDLKSRMLKQQNLTRSNRNFNYTNLNANDMNNTISELKKKWNEVNKKNKIKK